MISTTTQVPECPGITGHCSVPTHSLSPGAGHTYHLMGRMQSPLQEAELGWQSVTPGTGPRDLWLLS